MARDVDDVRATCVASGERGSQPRDEDERRRRVRELHFEHLERVDLVHGLSPRVDVVEVGHEPARVDRGAGGEALERTRAGRHRLSGEFVGARCRGGEDRVRSEGPLERERMLVVRVPERDQLGKVAVGQGCELGIDERLVRAGGAAHGLRRVVDEDVERSRRGDVVGEADHLSGVAQIDADDLEPVDPLGRVGQARESAHGVARKARRDRRVGAVAQQAQRDVHADLGATAGEQGALAREVGAGIPLGVAHRGAVGAQLVIERVDDRVRPLADVAGARLDEGAGRRGFPS